MRVCFLTNFITPYRKTFFEKLCANSAYDWLVLRGKVKAGDRAPRLQRSYRGAYKRSREY